MPAGSGNRRVVEQALAALPAGITEVRRRGDSALDEQPLRRWLEARGIGYAISADLSRELAAAIRACPKARGSSSARTAMRSGSGRTSPTCRATGVAAKDRPVPPRYLALRITEKQERSFAAMRGRGVPAPHMHGAEVEPFAIVTNRPDPEGGSGLDPIRWQRGKAGTIEHAHHVLTNELAAAALPSQRFGANAAWFRLDVMLHDLLSASSRSPCPRTATASGPNASGSCS